MITYPKETKFNNNLHCRKFINYEIVNNIFYGVNLYSNESQVKFCHEKHLVI